MARAWRLVKSRFATAPMDGEGAKRTGGRWNSPGIPVVYAADSAALATLEILVHLQSAAALASFSLIPLEFPENMIDVLESSRLSAKWRRYPAPRELQAIGDKFVKDGRFAILRVPSAIIPMETNFVMNPAHRDFGNVTAGGPQQFEIDTRLLKA